MSPHIVIIFPLKIFFLKNVDHFLMSLLNLLQYCFSFMFWFFGHEACGISVLWPGIEPTSPALEGEVPVISFKVTGNSNPLPANTIEW